MQMADAGAYVRGDAVGLGLDAMISIKSSLVPWLGSKRSGL